MNNIKKNTINLLDCQVELILQSLEFYSYTYRFIYPRKKSSTKEENLRISLVTDTYEQILSQTKLGNSREIEKFYKNIS